MKTEQQNEAAVSLAEAMSILGVCSATVRNWVRHQFLNAETVNGKLLFYSQQLVDLKAKILNGEVNRLNKRANKKESGKTFLPTEYAGTARLATSIGSILRLSKGMSPNETLFAVALNMLKRKGLVSSERGHYKANTKALSVELEWWALYVKALAYEGKRSFWMNFQQIKPAHCDVFVWVAVWRDVIKYWVLSSKEVENNKGYSKGQHRGNVGEGQLHVRNDNISEFQIYEVKPNELKAAFTRAYERQISKGI